MAAIEENKQRQALIDFVAGWFGGIACVYTGQPLDTIKVKMQTFSNLYKNSLDCAVQIVKKDGFQGFYAGSTPAVVANIAENSILFLSYGQCQNGVSWLTGVERKDLTVVHGACAGSFASIFACFALCPPELVKCRLQTARETSKNVYVTSIIRDVIQQEGLIGFYKGLTPLLLREVPGYFMFFGGYEGTKKLLMSSKDESYNPVAWKVIIAGGVGGMAFWGSVYPVDVIKSKLQVSDEKSRQQTMFKMATEMLKNEGIGSFYRGVGPTLLRSFPANAALFLVYEWTKKALWEATE